MKAKTVKQAFRTLVAVNLVAIVMLGGSIWMQSRANERLTAAYERRYQSYLLASELRQSSDDLTRLARTYVVTRDPSYKDQYLKVIAIRDGKAPRPIDYQRIYWDFVADGEAQPRPPGAAVPLLDMMVKAGFTKEEFAQLSKAKANSDGLIGLEVEAMNLVEAKATTAAEAEANHAKAEDLLHSRLYHHYKAEIMRPVDNFFVLLDRRTDGEVSAAKTGRTVALIFCVIAALVVVVTVASLTAFVSTRVLRGLDGLKNALNEIVNGLLPPNIPGVDRADEIGEMARAVVAFRDASADRTRLEQEAAVVHSKNEARLREVELSFDERGRNQRNVLNMMEHALGRLADGVLTFRLNDAFDAEYEKLRHDFNAAIAKMEKALSAVVGTAQNINSGAQEISKAADDLSRRTEQQAASLEETAAALDQITATVRKTADGAQIAHTVVSKAAEDASASSKIVSGAVEAMSTIERSSNEISQIISVIDEIAFQTNLLALNAGVEAARAGEAGRGFAVVAQEVRALAQRSADAAKEIKTLISNSAREVEHGVELVGQAGLALRRIAGQVTEITGIVEEISHSTQEQATGLAEVNKAVNQMDQMTQQNAAMVEQSTAASHNMAAEATALSDLTHGFEVAQSAPRSTHRPAGAGAKSELSRDQTFRPFGERKRA